jgi:hypothetical protein
VPLAFLTLMDVILALSAAGSGGSPAAAAASTGEGIAADGVALDRGVEGVVAGAPVDTIGVLAVGSFSTRTAESWPRARPRTIAVNRPPTNPTTTNSAIHPRRVSCVAKGFPSPPITLGSTCRECRGRAAHRPGSS